MSLRYVVLSLLHHKPRTGYAIVKTFDESAGYFWNASHQQVYRELGKLADEGYVSFEHEVQADKPDKKIYRINERGAAELARWIEAPLGSQSVKEPLLVKLLSIEATTPAVLAAQLRRDRKRTAEQLATYQAIEAERYDPPPDSSAPPRTRMLYITLRRGILAYRARLAWLDEALAMM